jgi:hypothetical protein
VNKTHNLIEPTPVRKALRTACIKLDGWYEVAQDRPLRQAAPGHRPPHLTQQDDKRTADPDPTTALQRCVVLLRQRRQPPLSRHPSAPDLSAAATPETETSAPRPPPPTATALHLHTLHAPARASSSPSLGHAVVSASRTNNVRRQAPGATTYTAASSRSSRATPPFTPFQPPGDAPPPTTLPPTRTRAAGLTEKEDLGMPGSIALSPNHLRSSGPSAGCRARSDSKGNQSGR